MKLINSNVTTFHDVIIIIIIIIISTYYIIYDHIDNTFNILMTNIVFIISHITG